MFYLKRPKIINLLLEGKRLFKKKRTAMLPSNVDMTLAAKNY